MYTPPWWTSENSATLGKGMSADHQPDVPDQPEHRPPSEREDQGGGGAAEREARTADSQDDGLDGAEGGNRPESSVEAEWANDRTLPDEYYDEPPPGAPAEPKSDSLTPSPEHQQTLDEHEERKVDRAEVPSASGSQDGPDRTPENSTTALQSLDNDSAAQTARAGDQQDDGAGGLESGDRREGFVEPEWNNDRTLPDEYYA